MKKPRNIDIKLDDSVGMLDEVQVWNQEDAVELDRGPDLGAYDISIAARDWTVETIVQQVRQGNIDLDPAFQRRNAWRDYRRSRLIESFILAFPVPQLVLAENPQRKKTFVVIDGKQRLMTISGLFLPEFRKYWTEPRFSGLHTLEHLNKVNLDEFLQLQKFAAERRQLVNADVRTTVITGFRDEGILYDIFYRINTGSVPLSSQELRQALRRGDFARYLVEATSTQNPLWALLGIEEPDPRLRDVELLLRLIAWRTRSEDYVGNMKPFLDDTMAVFNQTWEESKAQIKNLTEELFQGVDAAIRTFGKDAGKKFKEGRFERALNRAVFEVQAYYFSFPRVRQAARNRRQAVVSAFKKLSGDAEFTASLEATTKSIENYRDRFDKYRSMLQQVLEVDMEALRLGRRK